MLNSISIHDLADAQGVCDGVLLREKGLQRFAGGNYLLSAFRN